MNKIFLQIAEEWMAKHSLNLSSTTFGAYIKNFAQHLDSNIAQERRCTKCRNPFEAHHHIHLTRHGVFHTGCYNPLILHKNQVLHKNSTLLTDT